MPSHTKQERKKALKRGFNSTLDKVFKGKKKAKKKGRK